MDGEFDGNVVGLENLDHFSKWVLGFCDCESVAWYDDDLFGVDEEFGGGFGVDFGMGALDFGCGDCCRVKVEASEDDVGERAVHGFAHDVGEDGS